MTSLVKAIDQKVSEAAGKYAGGRKLGTYVIVGDAHGRAERLRDLARKEALPHVSLCIGTAPPRYEVAPEAAVTVVIYNPGRRSQQAVVANFALRQGELDETRREAVVAALSKVLPK